MDVDIKERWDLPRFMEALTTEIAEAKVDLSTCDDDGVREYLSGGIAALENIQRVLESRVL